MEPSKRPWIRPRAALGAVVAALGGCDAGDPAQTATGPTTQSTPTAAPSSPPPGSANDSHHKMVAALAEIAARAPQENRWQGVQRVEEARAKLAALPSDAGLQHRWRMLTTAGWEELRLGNEKAAIEHLAAAFDGIPTEMRDQPWAAQTAFRVGMAYFRYAESQNCCSRFTADSCILPIQGEGVHSDPEGSTKAIEYFTLALEATEQGSALWWKCRWLLNIAAMTLERYPDGVPEPYRIPPEHFESERAIPRFTNIAPRLGLDTFNLYGGALIDDFDNDGYLDLFTTTCDPTDEAHLFRNNADGTFTDITQAAGLSGMFGGLNCIQADYNNDGHVDIYILRGAWLRDLGRHPNSLLRNQGDGTFVDVTFVAGLGDVHYPTQTAAWADYDNDGDLDLFVGNEHDTQIDAPCQLFRNNGDETFTDVAKEAGVDNRSWVKGVVWGDYDDDRWPDLYISTMGDANLLYRNRGDGTFEDVAQPLGVDRPRDSFPVWFWDYDRDGALDLYVPSYRGVRDNVAMVAASHLGMEVNMEPPHLFRNDGKGGFTNVAADVGLTRVTAPMGANYGDLDADGYPDIYLGTGYPEFEALMPNVMYLNSGGQQFDDVTFSGGFGHLQKGHAISFADLDHDGDQDVFAQMGGALKGDAFRDALFENPGFGHQWVALKLEGHKSNRSAIGARIRLTVNGDQGTRTLHFRVSSGGSFGTNPLRQHLGLGKATTIEELEVHWPTSETRQTFRDVQPGRLYRLIEGVDQLELIDAPAFDFASDD